VLLTATGPRSIPAPELVTDHEVAEYTVAALVSEGFVYVAMDTARVRITDEGRDALASSS
jgi:hypothetical protein